MSLSAPYSIFTSLSNCNYYFCANLEDQSIHKLQIGVQFLFGPPQRAYTTKEMRLFINKKNINAFFHPKKSERKNVVPFEAWIPGLFYFIIWRISSFSLYCMYCTYCCFCGTSLQTKKTLPCMYCLNWKNINNLMFLKWTESQDLYPNFFAKANHPGAPDGHIKSFSKMASNSWSLERKELLRYEIFS